jgi:ABC-type transport system involved in cytochrome bd biosynthesis fused ATPase/permease subunit
VVVFSIACIFTSFSRNFFSLNSKRAVIILRKTLISTLYDKVSKLSIKSLNEINSGKIITIVSSDIFSVEKGLYSFCVTLSAPFINIACYIFVGFSVGWWFSLGIFGFFLILMVIVQVLSMILENF